jgi:hypothetical protein
VRKRNCGSVLGVLTGAFSGDRSRDQGGGGGRVWFGLFWKRL